MKALIYLLILALLVGCTPRGTATPQIIQTATPTPKESPLAPPSPTLSASPTVRKAPPSQHEEREKDKPTSTPEVLSLKDLSEAQRTLANLAIADLAKRMGVDPSQISLESMEPRMFRDSSLGVPEPGKVYLQVITPGYVITLRLGGHTYVYHGSGKHIVLAAPRPERPGPSPVATKSTASQ
ncbi:MAG: hypothetical protein J7M05_09305 [Anaerolineae bacterium]|nr:hypothetical protein [Anaerolineae bacterium]